MRVTSEINIENIEFDRLPVNKSTNNLVKYLESGGTVPPIHVERIANGKFRLLAGRHRVLASMLVGKKTILAHYAIPEAPSPDKDVEIRGEGQIPATDATPLHDLTPTPKE